ncbi:hypothetical protein [Nitrososphaera sp.]|uniref:hypothetical protein n=1 Tax=Nitrososphaera sp. TaxID=1971748 RepID=UPI00307EBA3A
MSGNFKADAEVNINAKDNANPVVESFAKRTNKAWRQYRSEQQAAERAAELNNKAVFASARVIPSAGRIAGQATNMYAKWSLIQLRQSDVARNVKEAQEDLSRAIATNGPDSEQANLGKLSAAMSFTGAMACTCGFLS